MMPAEEYYEAYEKASGLTINRKTINYYHLFHAYRSAVIVIASGYRPTRNGKTHQDVLVSWITGISYSLLDELRSQMAEVL